MGLSLNVLEHIYVPRSHTPFVHLVFFITFSFYIIFIPSSYDALLPPSPLNITALILPLQVQIFESAVKSLITLINLPDITVHLKAFW